VVAVISAVGVEELIEPVVRKMAPAGADVAGVGALADYRLGMSVMRAGAADYFVLPGDYNLLRSWLNQRAERLKSRQRRSTFAAGEEAKYRFEGIVGKSVALHDALDCATRIIPHPEATVLVVGEAGTGKQLLARAIHYAGPRCQTPFVEINCAASPENLLESQLFGHERGALADARMAKPGLFEVTKNGTLFLEQIEHLTLPLQEKLLRALEERRIRRLGGAHWIPIDARVIAASNVPLAAAVRRGRFREDLYSRLNVFAIRLPPLRARREDILPLARHFLARFAREYGLREPALSARAERSLRFHRWPGNVSELCNAVERAVLTSQGGQIDSVDLAFSRDADLSEESAIPFPATLKDITHAAAVQMMEMCHGKKIQAARRLGISRSRLERLLANRVSRGDDQEEERRA
jgi:DNA-binding NtrC family response regulator